MTQVATQATKTVEVLARALRNAYQGDKSVTYLVQNGGGVVYKVSLIDGIAAGCFNCFEEAPCKGFQRWGYCYHTELMEKEEATRRFSQNINNFFEAIAEICEEVAKAEAFQALKNAYDVRNQPIILKAEAILAAKREASAKYLAKMDEEVAAQIAREVAAPSMPRSAMARIAEVMDAPTSGRKTRSDKGTKRVKPIVLEEAEEVVERAERRYTAPLNNANREFSLTR